MELIPRKEWILLQPHISKCLNVKIKLSKRLATPILSYLSPNISISGPTAQPIIYYIKNTLKGGGGNQRKALFYSGTILVELIVLRIYIRP